jgi:lipopolysaccharide/colanic/teichoic acid biosynthesis glycosyltransferase
MQIDVNKSRAKIAPETRRLRDLYAPVEIHAMLGRERARADRHRREFSLVVFAVDGVNSMDSQLRLARMVLKHARGTDEVGYYDLASICAILPDTNSIGAWQFAQRVCESAKARSITAKCSVFAYPTINKLSTQNGEDVSIDIGAHANGNGHVSVKAHANGHANGHAYLNGNGHANGHASGTAVLEAEPKAATSTTLRREQLMPFLVDGVEKELGLPAAAVQNLHSLLVRPMPWWKRAIDIAAAGTGLLLISPLLAIVALAIKLTSPGPVIFKQRRAGIGGKPFQIYKFRTMCIDAEAKKQALKAQSEQDGPAFKIKHDPRITRVGRILRETSLDELPQLWNVVKGDMSLVGPRPLPVDESDECDVWQRRRLDVTPGLTCIWQVKGRSRVTFDEWVRMDISYIRRRKLFHDLLILVQTIPAVLLRRGAR